MESTGRIGEPLDFFEHKGTGERWSSTKSLQFQSDARATNLASAVRFVYQQNLTAGQSTAGDVLRALMPTPAQFAACKRLSLRPKAVYAQGCACRAIAAK